MRPYSPPTGQRRGKLRLDFNENTVGCPSSVLALFQLGLNGELLATYPDYEPSLDRLAEHFGVSPDHMVMTNGTDEAIQIIVNTFVDAGETVLIPTPTYAMYRFYCEVAGAIVDDAPYSGEELSFPIDRVLSTQAEPKALFLSNPNNPTGTLTPLDQIRAILQRFPHSAVLVDEAYFEFSGTTALPWIDEFPNLLVSRTMSKAYGLAGLRCGFLFSNPANTTLLKRVQSPYSVNIVAAMAAVAAVDEQDRVRAFAEEVRIQRSRVEKRFAEMEIRYVSSQGNFVLFWAGAMNEPLLRACNQQGVLLRDRSHEIPGTVRVTIGTKTQMDRFLEILEELWKTA